MLSKVVSKEEALTKIHDGQTIMFGDWHGEFAADEIIDGMLEKGIKDIHAIAVSAGMPDQGVGKLIREKRVKSLVTTHIALNPLARDQMFAGELYRVLPTRYMVRTYPLRRRRPWRLPDTYRCRHRS